MIKRLKVLFQTRLALRTTAMVMGVVGLLGVIFVSVAVEVHASDERRNQYSRIEELLSTVERTAQAACFLGDTQLAHELSEGLIGNSIISDVYIVQADGTALTPAGYHVPDQAEGGIERVIHSPFDARKQVCRIFVMPDEAGIDRQVVEASRFLTIALMIQLLGVGLCVVFIVLRHVTRPIAGISHRLSELEAETGQKLEIPWNNHHDEIGKLVGSVNAMIDRLMKSLGEERRLRQIQTVEERRYRTLFDNVDAGIFELDHEGRVLSANMAFRYFFGLAPALELERVPLFLHELPGVDMPSTEAFLRCGAGRNEACQWEVRIDTLEQPQWLSLQITPLSPGRSQGVAHNITEQKVAAHQATLLAMTDPLTGLGNRLGFERRLDQYQFLSASDVQPPVTLLLVDFDHFKQINDTYGHHAGDQALISVGRLLNAAMIEDDYLARLGGDEFVMLVSSRSGRPAINELLAGLSAQLAEPVLVIDGHDVHMGVSIGIAVIGHDTGDGREALRLADAAMYSAKRAGRNTWRYHERQ
ncbi:diguanylate cyclase domain-containing protein [Larsenimonas rhizosphaerae]|uniref:diguanylate cyclase domain-containing protein n=1 Tax=Larsenimonas rhizosphaerae TaxID=2944682 RepID=UPI00203348BA|nr:diguanylate cyclase [Larsenimonas rhizosphaerae]MCM2129394.1 diguanylate cyclase [Larsenimonas rhizosphaerae]